MSFNIRNIRQISNDQTTKFISHLAKKISDFANSQQTQELENKEDIYSSGIDVDSVLRFHSLTSTKQFTPSTVYYPPYEPDFDKVRLFIKSRNTGDRIEDWSGEGNTAFIHGEPMLIDGTPHDDGIATTGIKSTALRFNRPTSFALNQEYIHVAHNARMRVSEGLTTGVSIFIRFRLHSLSKQGDAAGRLFEKTDDTTTPNPQNGAQLIFSDTGRLFFQIRNSNVAYVWETATSTITTNTVYDVWITYNKTGNVVKIYVNNVDKSLTSATETGWHDNLNNQDLYIFRRGDNNEQGFVYGDLYDFRIYRDQVVSATDVSRMYTNKWTIYDIPFGQVMVADYYSTTNSVGLGGYDSTGYDSTGYDTS